MTIPEIPPNPQGLSAEEVLLSRKTHGTNRLTHNPPKSFLRRFIENFSDPIIRILLGALAINLLLLFRDGNLYESIGIAIAVFLSTFVSTISECGSEKAFRKLKEESENTVCQVIRDETAQMVHAEELVVGDIIRLQAGERIPADCKILTGELSVNLAAINGESAPQRRFPGQNAKDWSVDATSLLFCGATVTEGEATAQVLRVGDHTLYGSMAKEMQEEGLDSPLKEKLGHLAKILSRIGYAAAVLVAAADLTHALLFEHLQGISAVFSAVLHALTLGITVVVMAVPEGLPMMITVVLSANTHRMMKDHVMVRKLVGIETAGGINLLFTDKTGTLTRGKPEVASVLLGDGSRAVSLSTVPTPIAKYLANGCRLNSSAQLNARQHTIIGGNETEQMLLKWAGTHFPSSAKRIAFLPFKSENKFSAATLCDAQHTYTLFKGAPELLLPHCVHYCASDGGRVPLSPSAAIHQVWENYAQNGTRVIAMAMRDGTFAEHESFGKLTLLALFCIKDELRPEAKGAISQLQEAGIQVVMLTGDTPITACAIARQCGILPQDTTTHAILTGAELNALSDTQLKQQLPQIRVIARMMPQDKTRLIRIAQECGHVVGMTGDGINDAAALKRADVGFSMGSGTEIAKEASDIVILNNHIASITKAVLYGRAIFESIRKFIIFQLTMNLCAVGVSVIAPFIGIDTPVTVMQMLWINLIMDTLAGLAFAGEPPLAESMKRAPYQRNTPVLSKPMMEQIVYTGLYSIALCLFFLKSPLIRTMFRPQMGETVLRSAFFALFIFTGILNAFHARTSHRNFLRGLSRNRSFLLIMNCVMGVQIALIYFGGSVFRTVPLTVAELRTVIFFALTVLPAGCIYKWMKKTEDPSKQKNKKLSKKEEISLRSTPEKAL